MPDYSFGATGQLQELLDAIKQAQQNQKPQEPPKPADIITEATMQRVNANNAAYAQQQAQAAAAQQAAQAQAAQQQQQLMNPAQWHYGKQMLGYKNAYENADILAKALNPTVTDEAQLGVAADALRGLAHKNADNIRQIAKDAGIDLSGIEDASYADAQRNMLTRQTKEVADLLSGQGKYGRNSDRYFDDEYRLLTAQGKSPSEAKSIAGDRAQRYQADRVTYLRNAYNMYGRDGNYTNEYGVPILQEIAMETPEVAQVYATAYKLPTHAQNRLEKVADANLQQMFGERNALAQFLYNSGLLDRTLRNDIILQNVTHGLGRKDYEHHRGVDYYFDEMSKNSNEKREDVKYAKHQQRGLNMFKAIFGESDDVQGLLPQFMMAWNNISVPKTEGAPSSKETIDGAEKIYKMMGEQIDALNEQLAAEKDPKKCKALEDKIRGIEQNREGLVNFAGRRLGIDLDPSAKPFTGNLDADIPYAKQLIASIKANGGNEKAVFKLIAEWARETKPDISDNEIMSIIAMADGTADSLLPKSDGGTP